MGQEDQIQELYDVKKKPLVMYICVWEDNVEGIAQTQGLKICTVLHRLKMERTVFHNTAIDFRMRQSQGIFKQLCNYESFRDHILWY